MRVPPLFRRSTVAAALAGLVVLSTGCGNDSSTLTGSVRVAGSTTLLPLMGRATAAFAADHVLAPVNVRMTGTTDGITLLCDQLADIAGASRPITVRELRGCATAGVHPTQVTVTRDAVVLFTDAKGNAPACLALGDLYQRFASGAAGTQPPVVVPDASSGTRTMFLEKAVAPLAAVEGGSSLDTCASGVWNVVYESGAAQEQTGFTMLTGQEAQQAVSNSASSLLFPLQNFSFKFYQNFTFPRGLFPRHSPFLCHPFAA